MALLIPVFVFIPVSIFVFTGIKGFKFLRDGLLLHHANQDLIEEMEDHPVLAEIETAFSQARYYLALSLGQGIILYIMSFAI